MFNSAEIHTVVPEPTTLALLLPSLGILLASRSFHASELFAGIVLLGAIGFVSNALLALAERRLLRWQHP